MPAIRTGAPQFRHGKWYAQVWIAKGQRPTLELAGCTSEEQAAEHAALLSRIAATLRQAGQAELAPTLLKQAASGEPRALRDVERVVAGIAAGAKVALPAAGRPAVTFADVAKDWTSGKLAARFPDHVKARGDVGNDLGRLKHVLPVVRDVQLAAFKLEHAEAVMAALPARLSASTRRHVALLMHRVLALAVYPLRLIPANPLPRGWLPKPSAAKAKAWLYPDEERTLLACEAVPVARRLFYGFLTREGMRRSEALALTWGDVDIERGTVSLDENKTDDARTWALGGDVVAALAAWKDEHGEPDDAARVFAELGEVRADDMRDHLKLAGIDRPQLYERSAARQPLRVHDLRASFVTLALATGRSETWVADRTGHRSSQMINRYRRAARSAAELGLGWFAPLDGAIPELRSAAGSAAESATTAVSEVEIPCDPASAPGTIRTFDPRLRRPMLYPAELRVRRVAV